MPPTDVLTTWANIQIWLRGKVSKMYKSYTVYRLTFLMPSALYCRLTSFSGLTIGIVSDSLHVMLLRMNFGVN